MAFLLGLLLQLWATDVQEALALDVDETAEATSDLVLAAPWLWAALGAAVDL